VSFVWLAETKKSAHSDLVFGFADPSLPLLKVRPTDAAILWRGPTNISSEQYTSPNHRAPRIAGGTMPVVLKDSLVALGSATGSTLWQVPVKTEGILLDEISSNIYLTTLDSKLFSLNPTGGTNWTLQLHDQLRPRAVVPNGFQAGLCDVVLQNGATAITTVHSPRLLWNLPTTQALQAAPLVVSNTTGGIEIIQLLPGQVDFALSGLESATARTLWTDSQFHVAPNRPPALADLDCDGTMDVVVIGQDNLKNQTRLIVRRAADGKLVRAPLVALPSWISCTPAIADYGGTGRRDVAVATWDTHEIVMINGRNSDILWRHETEQPNMGGLAIADLEQDGLPDVVAASMDGHVYALRGRDGHLLWKSPGTNCASFSRPLIRSLNNDDTSQVLVTTLEGRLVVLDGKTGTPLWSPDLCGDMRIAGQAAVIRVKGKQTIIAPLGVLGAVAFDWQRRQELWRSPCAHPVIATPVIADLDQDCNQQVILGTTLGEVMVLQLADGQTLWRQKIAKDLIEADPVVADVNHDGYADLLVASHDFVLYGVDGKAVVPIRQKP
jgi:outer membrane protein assembly factor BamB